VHDQVTALDRIGAVGVETAAPALEPGQPDASRRRVTLQRGGSGEGNGAGRVLLVRYCD